jgi:hypothetical protein
MSERIKIIVNNDNEIIDFLADLKERSVIQFLEQTIKKEGMQSICLVVNCKKDNLFVVVLYNAPFEINENENHLMVVAHSNIKMILDYFFRYMVSINENNVELISALKDIISTVQYHYEKIEMKNTQTNFLG